MRFLKRIAGFLGLAREEGHDFKDDEEDEDSADPNHHHHNHSNATGSHAATHNRAQTGLPRKGFSVPVRVAVDRSQPGPVLSLSHSGDGGLQGLRWYAKRLKVDEDGDVADEFFEEITHVTSTSTEFEREPFPRFQLKYKTTQAKVKKQAISQDGRFQQCVEHQGRLQWV